VGISTKISERFSQKIIAIDCLIVAIQTKATLQET